MKNYIALPSVVLSKVEFLSLDEVERPRIYDMAYPHQPPPFPHLFYSFPFLLSLFGPVLYLSHTIPRTTTGRLTTTTPRTAGSSSTSLDSAASRQSPTTKELLCLAPVSTTSVRSQLWNPTEKPPDMEYPRSIGDFY
jgi:hypothetical protein